MDSAGRLIGAAFGLGLLALRRALRRQAGAPAPATAAFLAASAAALEGFPAVRHGARRVLGPGITDLAFAGLGVAMLTLSSSPLGLLVTGVIALRELTEVRASQAAWARYEARMQNGDFAPGQISIVGEGERAPLGATVVSGSGTAIGRDGLPRSIGPGSAIHAGSRLYGGLFELLLEAADGDPMEALPARPELPEGYAWMVDAAGLLWAALLGIATRSPGRALAALLLLSPRSALEGAEMAERSVRARLLRVGATVVARRSGRSLRLPDVILLDGPRTAARGLEVESAISLSDGTDEAEVVSLALAVAAAAGGPWGPIVTSGRTAPASSGEFDGVTATAEVGGARYRLGPAEELGLVPPLEELRAQGALVLALTRGEGKPLGLVSLAPRLAPGARELVEACDRLGIGVELHADASSPTIAAFASRCGAKLVTGTPIQDDVRARRAAGRLVALVSDSTAVASAFVDADLAVGVSAGRRGRFRAPVDVLVPDLAVMAAVIETLERRESALRESVTVSLAANAAGVGWLLRAAPEVRRASMLASSATLIALGAAWLRFVGGRARRSSLAHLVDPHPERWGRRSPEHTLDALRTREAGLTSLEATSRWRVAVQPERRNPLVGAVFDQLNSPLTAVLLVGAGLSVAMGSLADVGLIAAVIAANAGIGAAQEGQVSRAAAMLERLTAAKARVLRDGEAVTLAGAEVVPGDVLLLASGDRVAADARLLRSSGLEVDEAPLTGESLPVAKQAVGGDAASRVVLEGSDVTVGHGRAVVVAVGPDTRLGATAAALAGEKIETSPLGARLNRMLLQALPVSAAGGLLVLLSGIAWRRPFLQQLALGACTAIAAVPEGLPILAGIGQAAVARRLADRDALVRRLSAVEALGRVDVACVDKTGTLTRGRLSVQLLAGAESGRCSPSQLVPELRDVLLVGALAGPRPSSSSAGAHLTDVAVLEAATVASMRSELDVERLDETPFDPARGFHAVRTSERVCVKGAPDKLALRCTAVRSRSGAVRPLTEEGRRTLLARAERLALEGFRVLMIAEAVPDAPIRDPRDLVALGFLGLSDSLRPGAADAVARCRTAGVRLVMLTGDHPVTARAIGRQIGLVSDDDPILTGPEIADLDDEQLDAQLEAATVIARISPLEKLRIIESLKRQGHTVAMTGDGVNDAPALRLADVGVAMGRTGTEVARQAADIVLADDDIATLVEALVEGRTFWRNIRRSLAILLGGNLGEVAFIAAGSALGLPSTLTTRQVLAVNLGSDVLPALSLAIEEPRQRELSALAREGTTALGEALTTEILHRAVATSAPALAAYLVALGGKGAAEAQSVGLASIVATQLAQTLDVSLAEGRVSRPVLAATGASVVLLAATLTLPAPRAFLGVTRPSALGWLLVGASAAGAVVLARQLSPQVSPLPAVPAIS